MKVKLREIVDAMPAMSAFAQKEMPAKAAYRAGKLVRKMMAEVRDFERARGAAIKKHGVPIEGKPDQFRVENAEGLNAELEPLLDEEVTLEGCAPIPWIEVERLQLSPAWLTDLQPLFIEEPLEA